MALIESINPLFLQAILAFVCVVLLMPVARFAAFKTGFVDKPGGRKQHEVAVPPIGGLVIFPVFLVMLTLQGVDFKDYWPLFSAVVLLVATGGIDDRWPLPARLKFVVQFVAAILIVLPGTAQVTSLGDLFGFGPFGLNFMSLPFSIVAAVLLINAINLFDGLDGLSGGVGAVVFSFLSYAAFTAGAYALAGQSLLVLGVLAGFLVYNMRAPWRKRASVFIGDSGSLTLGLIIAWYCMTMASYSVWVVEPMSVAWLLALPIFDICGQFARRVRLGQHPFTPDHFHFHHHFIKAGIPAGRATFVILCICMLFGAFGVLGPALGVPIYVLTISWILLLFAHIFMSLKPKRFQKLISKLFSWMRENADT